MIQDGILGMVIGVVGSMDCVVKLGYRAPIAANERHVVHVMSSVVCRPLMGLLLPVGLPLLSTLSYEFYECV